MIKAPKRKFLDRNDPWFQKKWLRAAAVVVPAAMAALDFSMGNPGWGVVFAGAAGWALWELYLRKQD